MGLVKVNKARRRQRFDNDTERYWLGFDTNNKYFRYWLRRTVIFHYSNGTNRCCIDGCNADIDTLTLEHENFDKVELSQRLGYKSALSGSGLIRALAMNGFPDVGITVKCMLHNVQNKHPEHSRRTSDALRQNRDYIDPAYEKRCSCCQQVKKSNEFNLCRRSKDGLYSYCVVCDREKGKQRKRRVVQQAYALYGYYGPLEGMSWEHSNNDGAAHRKYLSEKYGYKSHRPIGSYILAVLLLREHVDGVPNWPGLIVIDMNENHKRMKQARKKGNAA